MTASLEPTVLAHPIGPDGLFVLGVRSADVRILGVDGPEVRVRARDGGSLEDLTVERGDRSLAVRTAGVGFPALRPRAGGFHGDLEVEVPAGATVVVEGASSDIVVEDLTGDQRIRTASGDVTLRGGRGTITVEAVSGDVDVTAAGPSAIAVRTVSGDLAVRAGSLSTLRATTTSGDLRIAGRFDGPGPFTLETLSGDALVAPADGVRIEVRTITGDVRSDLPTRTEGAPGHRAMIVGPGGATIAFRSASGDLRVVAAAQLKGPAVAARAPEVSDAPPAAGPRAVVPAPPAPALVAAYEEARLGVLRALERGDIDIDEARRRLEALDGGEPLERSVEGEDTDHA